MRDLLGALAGLMPLPSKEGTAAQHRAHSDGRLSSPSRLMLTPSMDHGRLGDAARVA